MRYFHKQGNHFWKPVINLDKVCFYVFFVWVGGFTFVWGRGEGGIGKEGGENGVS